MRAAFWAAHPNLSRKKIPDYSGTGKMHPTDVRCAFTDFVDMLGKDGDITSNMVQNVTLS